MALKDIEEKILFDAKIKEDSIISDANNKAIEIINLAKNNASKLINEDEKTAKLDAEKEKMQAVSVARLTGRDKLLTLKRQLISGVYQGALELLDKLPKNDYELLIEKILAFIGRIPSKMSVITPKGKEKQTEEALKKAIAELKLKVNISFGKETFDGVGGFIFDAKDMRIDGTFEHLLDEKKDEFEPDVVSVLFGGKQ